MRESERPEVCLHRRRSRDPHILAALASGQYTVDRRSGTVFRNGRPLKGTNSNGYRSVGMTVGGTRQQVFEHRVVWIAAHGPIPDGMQVNHRNRQRHDNRLENLELVTPFQNAQHAKGTAYYAGVRPEDEQAVDPGWLARVRALAERGDDATAEEISALRSAPPPPDEHGMYGSSRTFRPGFPGYQQRMA